MQGKKQRPYTEEDYKKVLKLKKRGLSQKEISNIVGVSSATVWYWFNTKRKPRVLYGKRREKKLPEESKKLTPMLAYIYGVLVGDGSISKEKGTYRISLKVIDKDFAQQFLEILEKWSGFKVSYSEGIMKYNHTTVEGRQIQGKSNYKIVRLCSKQLGEFLLSKGKFGTYNWEVPEDVLRSKEEGIICNFLKGLFDSEGCVIFSGTCRRIEIHIFYTKGLEQVKDLLKGMGIENKIVCGENKNMKTLRIMRKENIELFAKNINFTLKRKRETLEKLLTSYQRLYSPYNKIEIESLITNSLKYEPKTAIEISKYIKRSLSVTHYHLRNLENYGKLTRIKLWRIKNGNKSDLWKVKEISLNLP